MNQKHKTIVKHKSLLDLNPCANGLQFAEKYHTLQEAWDACDNPRWMVWYLRKTEHPKLLSVGAASARTVLPIFEKKYPDDKRPRAALDAVDRYLLHGTPIDISVRSAAYAAYAASAFAFADAAYAAYAAYAASADAADDAADAAAAKINMPNVIRSIVPKI